MPQSEEPVKIGYKVKIDSNCQGESAQEQFGDWWESCDNYFRHIRALGKGEYSDVNSSIPFKVGDIVFVVWLEWSSGDSFGHGTRTRTEVIAIFNNNEDAGKLAELLLVDRDGWYSLKENDPEYKESGPYLYYDSKDGQNLKIYVGSWWGYFETLDEVHVEQAVIQPAQYESSKQYVRANR